MHFFFLYSRVALSSVKKLKNFFWWRIKLICWQKAILFLQPRKLQNVIFCWEEKHEKLENWIENKYRMSLSWRLGRKRRTGLKKKPGKHLPSQQVSDIQKKKNESSSTEPKDTEILPGGLTQMEHKLPLVLGVQRDLLWVSPSCSFCKYYGCCCHEQKIPLRGSVRIHAFIKVTQGMCPAAKLWLMAFGIRLKVHWREWGGLCKQL